MTGLLVGPTSDGLHAFFIPAVGLLIFFMGYTSQWLFNKAEHLEPGPLTKRETAIFNILLACLCWTYYKACTVPPGRYQFPHLQNKAEKRSGNPPEKTDSSGPCDSVKVSRLNPNQATRWCKKCNAPKPLRAHHCRHCKTCIPKMDHHCPWTNNCVSLQTFPHFLRFLLYTNLSLGYLLFFLLYPRFKNIFWDSPDLPSYLGPSIPAMVHLILLGLTGGLVSIALAILLITTVHGWLLNTTMIESWEQERHEAVLLRIKKGDWWLCGDWERASFSIEKVEFPYDIGFFANMAQAMGTTNVLAWLVPLIGGGPTVSGEVGRGIGWEWDENGFNDREGMWPPPDPEKLRGPGRPERWPGFATTTQEADLVDKRWANPHEEMAAFRARQEMDLRRRTGPPGPSGLLSQLEHDEGNWYLDFDYADGDSAGGRYYDQRTNTYGDEKTVRIRPGQGYFEPAFEPGLNGGPGWTNSEGDRLRDYGVDEDLEDDEDIPLGKILLRNHTRINCASIYSSD